ncbi:hypothetical protein B0H66DRAFT_495205 [Apodospora peruviana]|uniref:intramembrane prenyl-peptidase Rce1 n=1 Tax=Apodospora peruviana TaxID=516989 RepID=A0AAE0M7J3_9PEZI|nr:hypothetical protein B0H66DRAFT_495205 [Apodospora peruviana]
MPALRSVLDKLNPWHQKDEPPPPPPITIQTASILVVVYALIYFLPFYLSRTTRPSPTLSRDAPSVIRARITSVSVSCVVCCVATYLVLIRTSTTQLSPHDILHLMGVWPVAVADSFRVLFLTALLFLGPLFSYFVVEGGWRDWADGLQPLREVWSEWTAWRNMVAGPITEEILYRSTSIPLMIAAQTPITRTIYLVPFIFGLSHVHHFYEFRLTNPQVPVTVALLRSVFQLGYTTLFGAYATFAFVRTGSLLAVCAVHAFCNCMGLPQLWGRVQPPPPPSVISDPITRRPDPTKARGATGGATTPARKASLLWTVSYYSLLIVGAVLWWRNLWVLTDTANALVPTSAFFSSSY